MIRFDYADPGTLAEASALLLAHGDEASLMAGGTDLLVEIKEQLRRPRLVIDLKRIAGLDQLAVDADGALRLGALVTSRRIETDARVRAHWPGLHQALSELGSIQVRHRATVVGNICRASPSADALPPLIADGAALHLHGPKGDREVALEDFFTGPGRTVLGPGEIVLQVRVPPLPLPLQAGRAYIKHGRRKAMELATVGVATCLALAADGRVAEVRIALGAVAPTPVRARAAERALLGERPSDALLAQAGELAMRESRPIDNVRASAAYRREMVGVLTRRVLQQALVRARGTPPARVSA
ncbi:MAG: xanthine dehydrogenase family protein subunit M [Burkholderiales bacterium]|nr:xanthine dehydrogenase family protein subunit M [Burkholderiales bacterium]